MIDKEIIERDIQIVRDLAHLNRDAILMQVVFDMEEVVRTYYK